MINVVVIGCGIAGSSHLVECVFHPNINVLAVCSHGSERAKLYSKQFDIPYYYVDSKICLEELKDSIDVVIFSVPPTYLEENIGLCNSDCMIIIDKPGIYLPPNLINKRVYFYYSRRSFSSYDVLFSKIKEAIEQGNDIRYRAIGPYVYRYTMGKTYLASGLQRGVILDTLCHFWDILLHVATSTGSDITIRNVKISGNPESQCQIILNIFNSEVIVDVIDSNSEMDDSELWTLCIENNCHANNSIIYSTSNYAFEQEYVMPYSDQIYNCFTQKEKGIFLDVEENNKILQFIDSLYDFLGKSN